jgi:hypothetical protein
MNEYLKNLAKSVEPCNTRQHVKNFWSDNLSISRKIATFLASSMFFGTVACTQSPTPQESTQKNTNEKSVEQSKQVPKTTSVDESKGGKVESENLTEEEKNEKKRFALEEASYRIPLSRLRNEIPTEKEKEYYRIMIPDPQEGMKIDELTTKSRELDEIIGSKIRLLKSEEYNSEKYGFSDDYIAKLEAKYIEWTTLAFPELAQSYKGKWLYVDKSRATRVANYINKTVRDVLDVEYAVKHKVQKSSMKDSSQGVGNPSPSPTVKSISSSTGSTSADSLVQSYFTNIKSGQYQKAWDMLPSDMQRNKSIHPNGYNSFTDWWKKTSVDVDAVKIVSQSDQEAVVNADVRYKSQKGSPQPLHLRYFLKRNSSTDNWVITKIKS